MLLACTLSQLGVHSCDQQRSQQFDQGRVIERLGQDGQLVIRGESSCLGRLQARGQNDGQPRLLMEQVSDHGRAVLIGQRHIDQRGVPFNANPVLDHCAAKVRAVDFETRLAQRFAERKCDEQLVLHNQDARGHDDFTDKQQVGQACFFRSAESDHMYRITSVERSELMRTQAGHPMGWLTRRNHFCALAGRAIDGQTPN
jgi:hypothetical protein